MENLGGQHTGPSPVLRGCLERPGKHGSQATREAGLGKIAVTRSPGACDPWLLFQAGFVMRDLPFCAGETPVAIAASGTFPQSRWIGMQLESAASVGASAGALVSGTVDS